MSGTCRTCKWLSTYKKNDDDIFWTYECVKSKMILDNETMKLIWNCHQPDDDRTLYLSEDRKARSIWKDKEDTEEKLFDYMSAKDISDLLDSDIFGTTYTFDLFFGKWVKINSKGEVLEILDHNPYEKK